MTGLAAAGLDLGGVALLRPWWLLGLPVALLAFLRLRRDDGLAAWRRAADPTLLAALLARDGEGSRRQGAFRRTGSSAFAAAALTALALSGPALERARVATYRNLDGVVLILDLSRSVAAGGNLVGARAAAQALAEAAGSRQVAILVYAGDAYVASPFTSDRTEIGQTLAALDGDTVPDAGSRPARALDLARRTLAEAGTLRAGLVLFSDGGGAAEAVAAAAALAADGHRLDTVFVPAAPAFAGIVPAGDRAALQALARAGGGDATTLAEAGSLLGRHAQRLATRLAASDYAVLAWADLGRWLLLAPALLLLPLFRRRAE